jgi:predicted nucleotidyltransferase
LDEAARLSDPVDRRVLLAAIIAERLKETGVMPVIVGGAAVEFYTAGGYSTVDIDIVAEPTETFAKVMTDLGFTKAGRFWSRPGLDEAVESPTGPLAGDAQRVTRVEIGELSAYVIGVEDLIVDRLNAYVHWRSEEDGRWTRRLIAACRNDLDLGYLRKRADEEQTAEALSRLLSEAGP